MSDKDVAKLRVERDGELIAEFYPEEPEDEDGADVYIYDDRWDVIKPGDKFMFSFKGAPEDGENDMT